MKNSTEIVVVIDKSGSMGSKASDVIGGFNAFVEEQRRIGANASLSLITFDTWYSVKYINCPISEVPLLDAESYMPGGGTALLDAIGRAINELGLKLKSLPEKERPENVVVVIMTDGEENSSHEFSLPRINEMIGHQRDKYNWKFMFIGVGPEAFHAGQTRFASIPKSAMAVVPNSGIGVRHAFCSVSNSIGDLRNGTGDGTITTDDVTITSTGDTD